MELFPEVPSGIVWTLLIFAMAFGSLYLDNTMGVQIGIIEWMSSVVIVPILIAALATRREGKDIKKMMGFRGDWLFAISQILMGAGLMIIIFFIISKPLLQMFKGTELFTSFLFFYLPLSSQQFWFLAMSPTAIVVFYTVIGVMEEILKYFFWANISNALYRWFKIGKTIIVILGIIIGYSLWVFMHLIAWQQITLLSYAFGLMMSIIFNSVYWLSGEPIISPERGFQINKFSIFGSVAAHATYDILLSFYIEGMLVLTMIQGILAGIFLMVIGGTFLFIKYYQMGYFQKGIWIGG